MNIKLLLVASLLSLGLSVNLPATAAYNPNPTQHLTINEKRVFKLADVMSYWYSVSTDKEAYLDLLDKDIIGLMYYREYDESTGTVYSANMFDVLPHDFDVILYLTENEDEISVHAINNHDGTVTIFIPGAYIAP